jgi:N-acetylmuramic acid 6-phosphate etherase
VKRPRAARGPAFAQLSTEARNPRSLHLDRLSTRAIVELVLDEDRRALAAARRVAAAVARAAARAADCFARGGRIVFAGAGTSGRLGVIEAAECPPTFGTDPARIRAAIAGGPDAVFAAREGAEDDEGAGRNAAAGLGRRDLLIGISASSVTPFVRAALAAARRQGAGTVLVTCARGVRGRGLADVAVVVDTGPEVLTGSTRLKAGSATKAVLNAITTAAMVRQGKTYENLMVDLRPGSAKLRDRARRLVVRLGEVTEERARNLLDAASGETKTAIVMARCGLSPAAARGRLRQAGGHLRRALIRRG